MSAFVAVVVLVGVVVFVVDGSGEMGDDVDAVTHVR